MKYLLFLTVLHVAPACAERVFTFGMGPGQVDPAAAYSAERGSGAEPESRVDGPWRFSVKLEPGVYRVQITLGSDAAATLTTVRSEERRLMCEQVPVAAGKVSQQECIIHVRVPEISPGVAVKLKDRERTSEWVAWDDKLTLELTGDHPHAREIKITPAPELPVLYIMGDSTVCDQPSEPYASWGQMLPVWFSPTLAVANYGQSGESLRSSLGARRLDKVVSQLKAGDFVLIQFGHNDEKDKSAGAGAFTTFADSLRQYARAITEKHAQPVFITPVQRRTFGPDGKLTNSHGDFPAAVKQVATELKLPLIDLHAMSTQLYEALGKEPSGALFKPGDGTHHCNYGAYELSRCVVNGLTAVPALASHLRPGLPAYNPRHPHPLAQFKLPPSAPAAQEALTPLGQ